MYKHIPTITIGSTLDRNAGHPWTMTFDFDPSSMTVGELRDKITAFLSTSPTAALTRKSADEFYFELTEGFFDLEHLNMDLLGVYLAVQKMQALASEDDIEPWAAYCRLQGRSVTPDDYRKAYFDTYRDIEHWAEDQVRDELPEHLASFFDYRRFAEAAAANYEIRTAEVSGGVAVFRYV